MPEAEAFNINFEASGVESNLLISNTGSVLWSTYGYIGIAFMSLLFFKVKFIWNKVGKKIYFNGIIRFIMSVYQGYCLLVVLNLATVDFDTPYKSEVYSNRMSVACMVMLLLVPPIFIILMIVKRDEWHTEQF